MLVEDITAFRAAYPDAMLVAVAQTRGSTPREDGAFMLVSATTTLGTIGGGQLEFVAVKRARKLIEGGGDGDGLDVALGPETGQCCGGRVKVSIERLGEAQLAAIREKIQQAESLRPHVYVFGAGHVGHALARALALLPVKAVVIDTRRNELAGLPHDVEARAVAVPEAVVRAARPGSAFVVMTHDHALDFLIVREALERSDAAYVGMIGSATKLAIFTSWHRREGGSAEARRRLTSPIGGDHHGDKRPAVIAALAAAEIMVHLARGEVSELVDDGAAEAGAGVRI